MGDALGALLPLAVGIAISPVPIIAAVLLLVSPKAHSASIGFLLGWILGILATLIVFFVLAAVMPTPHVAGVRPVQGAIHLLLGLLLLVLAIRQFRLRPLTADSPPPLPAWMQAIDRIGFWDALGLGILLAAVNPKNLLLGASAGVSLGTSNVGVGPAAVVVGIYTLVAAATILIPVIGSLLAGPALRAPLAALRAWLERENATIMGIVLLVLGVVVLGKGLTSF